MPKPWGASPQSASKAVEIFEEKCTSQGYLLPEKDHEGAAFTSALERIEEKLEALRELPERVQAVAGGVRDVQRGLQALERQQHAAPVPLLQRTADGRASAASSVTLGGSLFAGRRQHGENPFLSNPEHEPGTLSNWQRQVTSDHAGEFRPQLSSGSALDVAGGRSHGNERAPLAQQERPTGHAGFERPPAAVLQERPSRHSLTSNRSIAQTPQVSFDLPERRVSYVDICGASISSGDRSVAEQGTVGEPWNARRMSAASTKTKSSRGGLLHFGEVVSSLLHKSASSISAGEKVDIQLSLTHRGSASSNDGVIAAHAASIMNEILGEQKPSIWIMRPDWKPRLLWDMLLIVSITLNAMAVSFGLVYNSDGGCLCSSPTFVVVMHTADFLWVCNIAVTFCTGFMGRTGVLVLTQRHIAINYAKRWLAFDVLASWPLVLLPDADFGRWLFGLLKLLLLVRMVPLFARIQRSDFQVQSTFLKSVLAVVLPAHIMACFWRLASRYDGQVDEIVGGPKEWWPLYVKDTYWVLMTMTTVGYGDIVPQGTISRLFSISAMLIASVFFGAIVSVTSQAIGTLFDDPDERRMTRAVRFMRRRGVAPELVSRVEHMLRRTLQRSHQSSMDSELFKQLTPTVQRELALALLQEVVLQFPLFKGVNRSFVGELAQAQVWVQCAPGDILAEDGQLTREVAFVIQGRLSAVFGPRSDGKHLDAHLEVDEGSRPTVAAMTMTATLGSQQFVSENAGIPKTADFVIATGAWFGEACLFDEHRIRSATIVAREESDLAVLHRDDFFMIIQRYPRLSERHNKLMTAIGEGRLSIDELAYR